MTTNENQTRAMFAAHAADFSTVTAEGNNFMPEDGIYLVWLLDLQLRQDAKFYHGDEHLEGIGIAFRYQLVEDPDRETPLTFTGVAANIPVNPSQITLDNAKMRYEIELGRLKGGMTAILGESMTDDLGGNIVAIQNLIANSANGVQVRIELKSRTGKPNPRTPNVPPKTYRTDHVRELVSS